jgi:hypothetical protein
MLAFEVTKRTDARLLASMQRHYSQPKGFVGRNICSAITYSGIYYGHIVAGSATKFLPNRHKFLGTTSKHLNRIINNTYYHVEKVHGHYPCRNFVSLIISEWCNFIPELWKQKYGDSVIGFESLIELPRTGEAYRRAGWTQVGQTKGYTCKRTAGKGTDSWSGKRVWNTTDLRPKLVFCKHAE